MVDLGDRPMPVKVAHLRLCHSRVFLAVAYLREAQEMVFDAHWRAFSLWGGSCQRGIYDNMKTAVELIFTGKARQYNRRFLQMASPLSDRAGSLHAGGWVGEGANREPGRTRPGEHLHAAATVVRNNRIRDSIVGLRDSG